MTTDENEKATHSAIEAGEVEKYSKEFFRKAGSKSWEGLTPEQRSERARNNVMKRWS